LIRKGCKSIDFDDSIGCRSAVLPRLLLLLLLRQEVN
jgi:hypothetical protein